MRLHEYEATTILEAAGIPVVRRGIAETSDAALQIAREIGYPAVVKAQVLVGGRGLAGGVKTAQTPEELETHVDNLIGSEIKGLPVRKVLVCEAAQIEHELYMGVTVDGFTGLPTIVVCTEGGVNIEEVARNTPERITSFHVEPGAELSSSQAHTVLRSLGISPRLTLACADVMVRLYDVFRRYEALIVEINPLVERPNGGVMAVDAVLEIDDSAVFRIEHFLPDSLERIEDPLERRGREIGVTYVDLEGDIGVICSGAGLGMASMDIIGDLMKPANFLETGGGVTADLLFDCMELLMRKDGLKAILINIYGGINPIHEGARGVVRYIQQHNLKLPVVAKALGNLQEETWEIFRSGGVHVVTEAATEKAVNLLYELVGA